MAKRRPLPGLAARESGTELRVERLIGQRTRRTTCSAIVECRPQVETMLLPYQPTKTHTTVCIASLNCRSSIFIPSALSPRAKPLARDASHPELVMSGIPWPKLGGWAKSAKSGISWVFRRPTPRPSIHSWPRRLAFSCNLPATAPRRRHDMPITHAPRKHDLPTLPIRNLRTPTSSPTCVPASQRRMYS